ncbi:MAG: hypothetical protein ABIP35_04935 [Ginsengibacter sp.]
MAKGCGILPELEIKIRKIEEGFRLSRKEKVVINLLIENKQRTKFVTISNDG